MEGNLKDAQAAMRARQSGKTPKRSKKNGECWSKFGMVNADPASPFQRSIRNWGAKIKIREDRES